MLINSDFARWGFILVANNEAQKVKSYIYNKETNLLTIEEDAYKNVELDIETDKILAVKNGVRVTVFFGGVNIHCSTMHSPAHLYESLVDLKLIKKK